MQASLSSYAALALAVAGIMYLLSVAWLKVSNRLLAKELGCKPAFVRPSRLPLGIDTVTRMLKALNNQELQNDDIKVYEEMGGPSTWVQNILGTWYHSTVDPENIKAILATQFKDFDMGPLRINQLGPLIGHGIFTTDGKDWYVLPIFHPSLQPVTDTNYARCL